jgi:hypothetical protein
LCELSNHYCELYFNTPVQTLHRATKIPFRPRIVPQNILSSASPPLQIFLLTTNHWHLLLPFVFYWKLATGNWKLKTEQMFTQMIHFSSNTCAILLYSDERFAAYPEPNIGGLFIASR